MKILFCNIGWMHEYDGIIGDSIEGGGSYNENNIGHEVCNFSIIQNKVYGYVQPTGQIKIDRLGAHKKDKSISGITVIWTAVSDGGGTVVVGWYKNATVYREQQQLQKPTKLQKDNGLEHYHIVASSNDATLLPSNKRTLSIPRAVKGGIGQSNVWYADSQESQEHVFRVQTLIRKGFTEELPDVDIAAEEGNQKLRAHLIRERNSKLVKEKKKQVLEKTGKLCCEVCNFNFKESYGKFGKNFCEIHHLKKLSEADGVITTELSDLAVVCSNCHRVIHMHNPMLTIKRLICEISKKKRATWKANIEEVMAKHEGMKDEGLLEDLLNDNDLEDYEW